MKASSLRQRYWVIVTAALVFLWISAGKAKGVDEHVGRDGYIDTHNHPPHSRDCTYDDRIRDVVLAAMDRFDISMTFFMPPPMDALTLGRLLPCDFSYLADVAARHPGRFAFLLGGESLEPMITAVVSGTASLEATLPPFLETAKELLRQGAIGFGELAAEHFSLHEGGHPYIHVPPDHPLLLALADLAGTYDLPIDLHMEAIVGDIDPNIDPCTGDLRPPPNPPALSDNIAAFERLLRHNRGAVIVWVHAGWDNTGHRTAALTGRLLQNHPNLYIQLRPLTRSAQKGCRNRLTNAEGQIRGQWLDLFRSFPDRFMIGLDSFYSSPVPGADEEEFQRTRLPLSLGAGTQFVTQLYEKLPPGLARKLAYENAVRVYWLNQPLICHKPGTRAEQTMRVDASSVNAHLDHGDSVGPC
ncbi:MAG: amidohydrolase family protein [Deltaproteobacteria bacterium]|nr:amidohydrolase family protein [Deltaproteobacteria bacterium]